jgi:hypothetical protein
VLGIRFDTEQMEWSIGREKAEEIIRAIEGFEAKRTCSLKDVQKRHGKLANVTQAGEFMRGYRYNLLELLGKFGGKDNHNRIIGSQLKDYLWVWKKYIWAACNGMRLGEILDNPPLETVVWISDAAGAAMEKRGEEWVNNTVEGDRGVASLRYRGRKVKTVCVHRWPKMLLTGQNCRNGKYFGSKSCTLEAVGLLMAVVTDPATMVGRHVVLEVDNLGVVYGWEKKHCKEDPETSLLLRCLHVLEAKLSCKIYVKHVKRCSTEMALLADKLSRASTTDDECREKTKHASKLELLGSLKAWLENPVIDWTLPEKLCKEIG